jgi:hypothetical protein
VQRFPPFLQPPPALRCLCHHSTNHLLALSLSLLHSQWLRVTLQPPLSLLRPIVLVLMVVRSSPRTRPVMSRIILRASRLLSVRHTVVANRLVNSSHELVFSGYELQQHITAITNNNCNLTTISACVCRRAAFTALPVQSLPMATRLPLRIARFRPRLGRHLIKQLFDQCTRRPRLRPRIPRRQLPNANVQCWNRSMPLYRHHFDARFRAFSSRALPKIPMTSEHRTPCFLLNSLFTATMPSQYVC